jgi:hypothetical protein
MENEDDRLTRLMRERSDGYIMDDGFAGRVMEKLPARRTRASRVIGTVVAGLAAVGCAVALVVVAEAVPGVLESVEKLVRSSNAVHSQAWSPYVYVAASLTACAVLSVWAMCSDER